MKKILRIKQKSVNFQVMIAEDKLIQKINSLPPGRIVEVIDFVDFLAGRESSVLKADRAAVISAYAAETAGTEFDLDEELEQAGIEHLTSIDEASR